MKSYLTFFYLCLLTFVQCFAQDNNGAIIFHIHSSHTSFPDTGRKNGHLYNNVLYTFKDHYNDSTVLIIAPKNLAAKNTVDMVFWFHGWGNNVDSATIRYELTKQFIESKRNAVLVLAETARNSPDSYGGKLENPGEFKALVADVLQGLKYKKLIPQSCAPGHILLAGHSGAYRVMARVIQNGQMPIDEVMLFDALYGETDLFVNWIKADHRHRFVHLFTDHGGTFDESHRMVKVLDDDDVLNLEVEETKLVPAQLCANNIIFIHSLKEHNDIVNPDNFKLMLENEPFLKKL
ncbi:MAG TPA: hypothetical protein VGI43_16890 [Mucilaginibacter sp.]|jgi:hypothetical protein